MVLPFLVLSALRRHGSLGTARIYSIYSGVSACVVLMKGESYSTFLSLQGSCEDFLLSTIKGAKSA